MTKRVFFRCGVAVALLGMATSVGAETRHVRYRLDAPAADTIASLRLVPHKLDEGQGISQWWG